MEPPQIDRGVNEENISFKDPFEEAQEQRAIEMAIMASARYYNVTSVINVRQSLWHSSVLFLIEKSLIDLSMKSHLFYFQICKLIFSLSKSKILQSVGKCQCGSKVKIKKEDETRRTSHCKNCSCVKRKRLCGDLCSCSVESCANREPTSHHQHKSTEVCELRSHIHNATRWHLISRTEIL